MWGSNTGAILFSWSPLRRNGKWWAGGSTECKMPNFPPAWWLGWSRAALGQVAEGKTRTCCREHLLGWWHLAQRWLQWDGEQCKRVLSELGKTWLWEKREDRRMTAELRAQLKPPGTKPFTFCLPSFLLIKLPWSGSLHSENLMGKQKLQSVHGWECLFFFLSLILCGRSKWLL